MKFGAFPPDLQRPPYTQRPGMEAASGGELWAQEGEQLLVLPSLLSRARRVPSLDGERGGQPVEDGAQVLALVVSQ